MIREKWNADWKFKKGGPSLMGSLMVKRCRSS